MKATKHQSPFNFARPANGSESAASAEGAAPDAPPALEAELEIVQAPAVEMDTASPMPPVSRAGSEPMAGSTAAPAVLTQVARFKEPSGWPVWLAALVVATLWAAAPVAFALGWRVHTAPLDNDPLALMLFAILAIGPAALVLIAAYVVRQGQKLGTEVRRTRDLAERMLTPAAIAAAEAGSAIEAVRLQIDSAASTAHEARETMLALRQALAEETERLSQAAALSVRTAADLALTLGSEREQLRELSGELDQRTVAVGDSITKQARMVAEASDLAETQLREAEAALAARAADLAAAAGEASDAARVAGEDLARQVARLETAGLGVGDQMRMVEEGLTQQRAALVTVSHAMRADQEDFAAMAESRSAQLAEFMLQATQGASTIGEQSAQGADALRQLINEAAERLETLTGRAREEREGLGEEAIQALARINEAAVHERLGMERDLQASIDRLSEAANAARKASEGHAEAARVRVDQLSEAAFAAHQKADAIFESRLADARNLVEQSAQLVEQAGAATVQRLEQGVEAARGALSELGRMLDEVEARSEDLPEVARGRAEEVKASVERSMEDLMSAARRAADETQTIDAAFQERVRRNYDMLSEAVKVMGVAAGSGGAVSSTPRKARAESPAAKTAGSGAGEEGGHRQRLKLTPTATDEEFRSVFDTAGGRSPPPEAAEGGNWSWRELLTSIDGDDGDGVDLANHMAGQIAGMGIDPAALLPKSRIDEISVAIQARDTQGAREVVRRLAPAAIRRLVRRLFSDAVMRGQTDRFVARFSGMLDEAADRDRGGTLVTALLASESGRTWLLLDAAAGDLA